MASLRALRISLFPCALVAAACGGSGGDGATATSAPLTLQFALETTGDPVTGARGALANGGSEIEATSDPAGRAIFSGAAPGDYQLRFARLPRALEPLGAPDHLTVGVTPAELDVVLRFDLASGELLLYGDGDSSDEAPYPSSLDDDLSGDARLEALLGRPVTVVNRALLDVPVARDVEATPAAGVDLVEGTLDFHPATSLVLLRFGRIDVEHYLADPTPAHRARFEDSYREVLRDVLERRDVPVLSTLSMPRAAELRAGTRAANEILAGLAAELDVPIVVSDLDAQRQPELFEGDGTHHSEAGQARLAELTVGALVSYFTGR